MDKFVIRKHKPSSDTDSTEEPSTMKKLAKLKGDTCTFKTSFKLSEVQGDLFSCPESESLAHCISEDIRMGKGIAVIFKKKFGAVEELREQGQKPGGVAILKKGNKFIYYLVTKEKYFHKPTYKTLQRSLVAMRDHCCSHGVKGVSMPRIGCGLDGLQWPKVRDLLTEVFHYTNMTITVYSL